MTPRQMQLTQLKKYAPDLHQQASTGQTKTGAAMVALLERDVLFNSLLAAVKSGNIQDKMVIGTYKGHTVTLTQQPDLKMRLYARGITSSDPVVMYGRDWKHQSSAYAGEWKITDDARAYNDGDCRRVFDAWLRKIEKLPVYSSRYNGAVI